MIERDQALADEVAELERQRGSEDELKGFQRIDRLAPRQKEARAVLSLRVSASEMKEITIAASAMERNVSEFIREAALREARQVRVGIEQAREFMFTKKTGT